jgi:hypothetical protein
MDEMSWQASVRLLTSSIAKAASQYKRPREGAIPLIEQRWLACTDPQEMLLFLRGRASGNAGFLPAPVADASGDFWTAITGWPLRLRRILPMA